MDDEIRRTARSVADYLDHVVDRARRSADVGESLVTRLTEHLGVSPTTLPVVAHRVPSYQLVNLDIAMQALVDAHGGGDVIGIGGGEGRRHNTFSDMIHQDDRWNAHPVVPAERVSQATGPTTQRESVSFGVHLFRYDGNPVAVLRGSARPQFGQADASIEVVAAPGVAEALIGDVRRLIVERSVFRGQVLTLGGPEDAFRPGIGGIAFHARPDLSPAEIVLPDGVLQRVERHVAGPALHRDSLLAAGQHLKRGLLLFGPPGTGKTHTVRYLLGRLDGVTVVLLSGTSLGHAGAAAELARALQPALVVLEDVDLVAQDRDRFGGAQPLLFTVLEAMDGLGGDADVAFVLTTNRPDLLEPALAQRPGRVDLAVEIPLPDAAARRRLVRLYGGDMPFSAPVLDRVADRTDGSTASLFKELVRRGVLLAASDGRAVASDSDLLAALDELMDEREQLTRSLLGTGRTSPGVG